MQLMEHVTSGIVSNFRSELTTCNVDSLQPNRLYQFSVCKSALTFAS